MLRRDREQLVEVGFELREPLVGCREDQVARQGLESGRTSRLQRETRFVGAVGAPEAFQRRVVEALDSERQAVHARLSETGQPLAFHAARVHLECDLDRPPDFECGACGPHDAIERLRPAQRRRATTEVQAREFAIHEGRAAPLEFAQHRIDVAALDLGRERSHAHHREVAIRADALAERDMDVDTDGRCRHSTRVVQAAMRSNLRSVTLPGL